MAVCAALLVAGCGSSTASTGSASASGGVAAAQREITQYSGVPSFVAPGRPFDARRAVAGRTLESIPASSSIPFVQSLQDGVKALAPQVGLRFLDWPNQGQPVQWVQGMNAGASRKVNAINLMAGIDPNAIAPQVRQAEAAHIPVIASHLYDVNDTPAVGVDTASVHYEQAGRLLADWVVARTNGKADALVVRIDEVNSTASMVNGISSVFQQDCGSGCKVQTINVGIADVASRIQPEVQAALTKDPSIDYVIALYDSAEAPFVVSAIKASGRSSSVHVVTYNGTPSVLRLVRSGDVEMDIGENLEWISYGILDQAMRLMGGLPPVRDPRLPLRVFDRSNIDEAGNPPQDDLGFGDAYKQGYLKLWGLAG